MESGALRVTWSSSDAASGVDGSTCELRVQEDEGTWQPFSTACDGDEVHSEAQPGHVYTFRLSATDNVSNGASTEAVARFPRVTKYYYHPSTGSGQAGGQRVAMRADGVVYYLHGDHLGSTSLTTGASGAVVARQLYHPYGTVRAHQGTLPTDFGFTGQRAQLGLELVFMHARYYHAGLGRFTQADTIVPEAGNPQDFNRYAYVRNNPLRYRDPSGHCIPGYNCPGDKGQNDPIVGGIWTPPPHEGPGRPVSQERRDEARKCILGAAIFDTSAAVVSLWGAELEFGVAIVVASSDGPLPVADIAGPLAGVVAYQKTLGKVENWLGLASGVNTIAADILGGYTYIDSNTEYGLPEIVIGQNTVEDLIAGLDSQLLGLVIPEAFVDTVINASQALDNWMDLGGMSGNPTWELRVTWDGGWYTKHYDNK